MRPDLEFILGLLDRRFPAFASADDFASVYGPTLRCWQRLGFLSREPEANPVPSCPHCREGVPSRLGGRFLCAECLSEVDPQHLLLWRFQLEAFLSWLVRALKLKGGVRQIDESLWQLGGLSHGDHFSECFFVCGTLSSSGRQRLLAYRDAVVFRCLPTVTTIDGFAGVSLALLDVLRQEKRSLKVTDLARLLQGPGAVRFDEGSGTLWAGDVLMGEVPVGGKEYFLLACLSHQLDRFVPYGDIKNYVLSRSGSRDTTEEATFCQRLKNRAKKWVPKIDALIATTNKADGYRLRGRVGGP